MAVQDLWLDRHRQPTARHGRGLRYRVTVSGHPTRAFATKDAATRWEARLIVEGPDSTDRTTTVGQLVDVWLAGKQHLSPKGLEACELAARAVRGAWGSDVASEVDAGALQAWLSVEPGSASRKHKLSQCLAGAFAIAVRSGRLSSNPAEGLMVPKEVRRDGVFLSPAQVRAIADAADGRRHEPGRYVALRGYYGPLVWLLATTGLRIGEALALRVGDVSKTRRRARVRQSKTGTARDVPVPASVLAMLDLDRPVGEWLFVTPHGKRVDKDLFRARGWKAGVKAAGVQGVRIHDLRHTAASLAIASGADVKAVQRMLGHKSAAMTMDLYGHLWDRGLDDVADRLDALVSAPVAGSDVAVSYRHPSG